MPPDFKIKSVTEIAEEASKNEEQFKSQFPDQVFKRPCQRGLMAFATNEVNAGSNPAGRSKIVLQ